MVRIFQDGLKVAKVFGVLQVFANAAVFHCMFSVPFFSREVNGDEMLLNSIYE